MYQFILVLAIYLAVGFALGFGYSAGIDMYEKFKEAGGLRGTARNIKDKAKHLKNNVIDIRHRFSRKPAAEATA